MKFFRKPEGAEPPVDTAVVFNESELRHLESETRLADVPDNFEDNLLKAGAKIETPLRLLKDTRFSNPQKEKQVLDLELPSIDLNRRTSHQALLEALNYAGFSATAPGLVDHFAISGYELPRADRLVRIRNDGLNPKFSGTFEVKGPKVKDGVIKKRPEYPADFNDIGTLQAALAAAGFQVTSYFEKHRVTLSFNGCKVEVDSCPIAEIGRWAEVEGQTDLIQPTLDKIIAITGYKGQVQAIGQREFIKAQIKQKKLSGVDLNHISF